MMRRFVKCWLPVALSFLAACAVLSTAAADDPVQPAVDGTPVAIAKKSSLNLEKFAKDLAKRQALAPAAPIVPRAIHSPLRPRAPEGRERRVGAAVKAIGRGVVNVAEAAKAEALAPASVQPPRAVHAPKRPGAGAAAPAPRLKSPDAVENFAALDDLGTSIPADTNGAVGPNHLMVTLNTEVGFQDRKGKVLHRITLNNFWSSVINSGTDVVFDPKVLFDPFEKRWIFVAPANPESASSALLVAASKSDDPTGDWSLYSIPTDPSGKLWFDYPSVGFNKNWVVVQGNMFAISRNSNEFHSSIYVFKKADLFAGVDSPSTQLLTRSDLGLTQAPEINGDNSDSMSLVESPDVDSNKVLKLYKIIGDVDHPKLQAGSTVVNLPDDWDFGPPDDTDFAPQNDPAGHKLQDNDARALGLVSRNGLLYFVQTAFLPSGGDPTESVIQWAQLDPNATNPLQQSGRIDDQDQPGGKLFRGFPSIAVNKNEDVLIGFSRFHGNAFAGASYALLRKSDTSGQFRVEAIFKGGNIPYFKTFGGGRNRWGDYSNTVVDPTNDVDFWTVQIYADAHDANGDHWGTWWAHVDPTRAAP
jgi:hypothetical protein